MLPELCKSNPLKNASLPEGFCVGVIPVPVNRTRTIISLNANTFIALESGNRAIILVSKKNTTGTGNNNNDSNSKLWTKRTLLSKPKLLHGLTLHKNYIYASTDENVYRWSYTGGINFTTIGTIEHVVFNISGNGTGWTPDGHMTRTIKFDTYNRFYMQVGSSSNLDKTSYRSRIRRINKALNISKFPYDYDKLEVFADGIRNAVGLAFDPKGILWGVSNGAGNLTRSDLGGDLNLDNPADEFHIYNQSGIRYGYPYCFTEYKFPKSGYGLGRGTAWAWPTPNSPYTDTDCRGKIFQPPVMALQGHSAPLGLTFYKYKKGSTTLTQCKNIMPFPKSMHGYAFIAYHGSAPNSRPIRTGYKVVYIPMPLNKTIIKKGPIDFLKHAGKIVVWEDNFRPVDVTFDECGRLLITSDGSNNTGSKVVRIQYYSIDKTTTSTIQTNPSNVNISNNASLSSSASSSRLQQPMVGLEFHYLYMIWFVLFYFWIVR
jgi:glucose/arabinose dehydrogenase